MPAKPQIIADPQTNRGTAFTVEERKRFGLMGRLPAAVETLEHRPHAPTSRCVDSTMTSTSTSTSNSCTTAMRRCTTR